MKLWATLAMTGLVACGGSERTGFVDVAGQPHLNGIVDVSDDVRGDASTDRSSAGNDGESIADAGPLDVANAETAAHAPDAQDVSEAGGDMIVDSSEGGAHNTCAGKCVPSVPPNWLGPVALYSGTEAPPPCS